MIPGHAAAEPIAIAPVSEPLQQDDRAWEAIHTGGGCMAWENVCDDGAARIWICDNGQSLGDDQTDGWLVGLHPYGEWLDHWQGSAKALDEALHLARLAQAARAFALGFNPKALLTYREFVATGRPVSDLGVAIEHADDATGPGRVYVDRVFMTGTDADGYSLVIGNVETTADRYEALERALYEFAASEGYLEAGH